MSDKWIEMQRARREQQVGTAVLKCGPSTRSKILELVLDDQQGQVDQLQEDGADDDDSEVKILKSRIANCLVTMKAERIKPAPQWQAHFDTKVAAQKKLLEDQRIRAGSARRKLQSNRDHQDREAELRLAKRLSETESPEESA